MKANELKLKDVMCEDWVDVRNDVSPNTPHIEKITPSHFLRDEHWYGIELTPEILEKNGFSNKNTLWYLEKDNFELEHNNNDSFIWIVGDVYIVAFIKYVHQLQHAMRLCGIDKEIVL